VVVDKLWTAARRYGPALVVMVVIFLASARAKGELPDFQAWDLVVKKSGHLFIYGLLGVAYLRALIGRRAADWRDLALAIMLAALYGASDEFHQTFVAGRGATVVDVLIDTIGAVAGLAANAAMGARARRAAGRRPA
jgi:VanZ family protein